MLISILESLANFIVYKILSLEPSSHIAEVLTFFIVNITRVYILVLLIGFLTGIVRSYITPEKTKEILKGKQVIVGNLLSSFLAVVTPVEGISVVPLFVGLIESGVAVSVAFVYLITAPITNEVAFALFFSLFGYKVALAYYGLGIVIGLIGGIFIGALDIKKYIKFYIKGGEIKNHINEDKSFLGILKSAKNKSFQFFKDFWLYIFIGVLIAAIIEGYVPQDLIVKYVNFDNPLAIPIAVFMVIFFYVNIVMSLPIIMIFVNHGLPLGTILAFTMAITATSVPELIMMKKALKMHLIIIYLTILLSLIVVAGYIINIIIEAT